MIDDDKPLHILFAAPAYWPATAFGGPIPVMRELARGLVLAGCTVDVVTTALTSPRGPRSLRTRTEEHQGSTILYAATPASYRWMGITPTLPVLLQRRPRPDAVHVFGFRDPVGTTVAAWCRVRRIPYVFEALGMFRPKLRKVGLKRALDTSIFRHVPGGATRLIACSRLERDEYVDGGIAAGRVIVRPNGFPAARAARPGMLRSLLAIPTGAPLVLSVGRIASGKGLEMLVRSIAEIEGTHLALVGPDDGHGTSDRLRRLAVSLGVAECVHLVGPLAHDGVLKAYADADVVALASAHESFGMVAAEAASAGRAILLTDRCGVAELLTDAALVVPYDEAAIARALVRLLADAELRTTLGAKARSVAARHSWDVVVARQEDIYRQVLPPMTDLAVVAQDPRFGRGALAQLEAFWNGATALGRDPDLLYLRRRSLAEVDLTGSPLDVAGLPGPLSAVDALHQTVDARRLVPPLRRSRSVWVVATTASYGFPAARSGRRYACWIGTAIADEHAARREGLSSARALALAGNPRSYG